MGSFGTGLSADAWLGVTTSARFVCSIVQVLDYLTHVTVCQRYTNTLAQAVDCKYVFPMDATAAVNRLVVRVNDDRVIEGQVMESAAAREKYATATRSGDGAYLVEQSAESVDVFEAAVGNLLPGANVEVRISYVSEVALEGTDLRFVIPTAVAPRYEMAIGTSTPTPATALPAMAGAGAGAGAVPTHTRSASGTGYPLTARVAVEAASTITSVTCPSHKDWAVARIAENGTSATVTVGIAGGVGLGGDMVILVRQAQPHQPRVWVESLVATPAVADEEDLDLITVAPPVTTAIMVSLYPDLPAMSWKSNPAMNVVFLVDCSGSMSGSKMEGTKSALQLCLRSLPVGSRFQIVSFGSTFRALFPGSGVEYNDESLAVATAHVDAMTSNYGAPPGVGWGGGGGSCGEGSEGSGVTVDMNARACRWHRTAGASAGDSAVRHQCERAVASVPPHGW